MKMVKVNVSVLVAISDEDAAGFGRTDFRDQLQAMLEGELLGRDFVVGERFYVVEGVHQSNDVLIVEDWPEAS